MNADQKELFRIALLRVLDANRTRFGLALPALCLMVRQFGFAAQPNDPRALDEIDYLTRKGLLEEAAKPISAENRAWRITGAGIAFLDEQA
jgi:hypothetical protein